MSAFLQSRYVNKEVAGAFWSREWMAPVRGSTFINNSENSSPVLAFRESCFTKKHRTPYECRIEEAVGHVPCASLTSKETPADLGVNLQIPSSHYFVRALGPIMEQRVSDGEFINAEL